LRELYVALGNSMLNNTTKANKVERIFCGNLKIQHG
jgi:hypothetical protein